MKVGRLVYFGVLALMLILALGLWKPLARADHHGKHIPQFTVAPSWPKPFPAPVGSDGVAHTWVEGEVAGTCIDAEDHVFTVNRAWEVGVTIGGG